MFFAIQISEDGTGDVAVLLVEMAWSCCRLSEDGLSCGGC
jgi:hypothetical protein